MSNFAQICLVLNRLIRAKFPNKAEKYRIQGNNVWMKCESTRDYSFYCLICDCEVSKFRDSPFTHEDKAIKHGLKHIEEYNLLSFI